MRAEVRVRGLREAHNAMRAYDKGLAKALRDSLKKAAEPVANTARSLLSRYQGAKLETVKPFATGTRAGARQNARKVTGTRPDFGALQMRNAFIPALEQHADEIPDQVQNALDSFAGSVGF